MMMLVMALLNDEPGASAPPASSDIVITGEKLTRTLRETASSVAVVAEHELEGRPLDRVEDVLASIPNIQVGSGGIGMAVRGQDATGPISNLTAFIAGVRPRMTLQIDGREASYNELVFGELGLWDIKQVEVFRTPQILNQGRSALAGSVYVTSRDPEFDWTFRGRAFVASRDTRSAAFAISGPLIDHELAFRFSGDFRAGRPASKLANPQRGASSDVDRHALFRGRLLFRPASMPGSRFRLGYSKSTSRAPQIEGIRPPYKKRRDGVANYGIFDTDIDALSATAEAHLGHGWRLSADASLGWSRVRRFAARGLGETWTQGFDRSVDIRLDKLTERSRISFGTHLKSEDLDQIIDLSVLSGVGRFSDERGSAGIYGEIEQRLGERWTVAGGVRYQRDRQQRIGRFDPPSSLLDLEFRVRSEAWLPRLVISYDHDPDWRFGVLVQRAASAPGASLPVIPGDRGRFGEETAWNLEAFARGKFSNGRGRLDVNVFHNMIDDYQLGRERLLFIPGSPPISFAQVINIPKVRSQGVEAAFRFHAFERWSLAGSVGLLDTKIVDAGTLSDLLDGNDLPRTPGISGRFVIQWQTSDWELEATFRGHGTYFSDEDNSISRRVRGATFLDLRAERRWKRAKLFGFVRNLFDRFAFSYRFGTPLATAFEPREIGVGLATDF